MTSAPTSHRSKSAELRAHPGFMDARRLQIDGYLALYSGDPALNKLLVEGARHVIFTFVVCLAAAQRDDDPATWLTLGKLQDLVVAHQLGSPGLVESLVSRMLDRGLLTATPAPGDRRKRILAPTAALLAHDADLIAVQAAPCMLVAPSSPLGLAIARDRAFHQAHRVASVAAFGDAMVLLGAHPEMMGLFVARDSGLLVLYALLASALSSSSGTRSTVAYQNVADRFGVSRTHVRELVADAAAAGLMQVHNGGEVEILPPSWPLLDCWIADCMALFIDCCEAAQVVMDGAFPQER